MPLRVEREREADVGVQAALVELVEQHRRDALERRIALQHAREHAFGDDLDARAFADARLEPHAVADGVADALAERRGHALGDGARREPARLEHHDALAARPRLLEQRERHDGALAGAGRRDDDGVAAGAKRSGERGEGLVDRQAGPHVIEVAAPRASARRARGVRARAARGRVSRRARR